MSQAVAADIFPCARCGYDLRTLPDDSNCPECGLIIAESASVRPLLPWLRRFRRGVTFLLPGLLLAVPYVEWWLYLRFHYDFRTNPEGGVFLTRALLFVPAIWFMTIPDPLVAGGRRYRKVLLALTILQIVLSCCALSFYRLPVPFLIYGRNAVLLSAYALMPLVYVAQLWLLLELLYRSLPIINIRCPRPLFRVVQWPFIYSILSPAVFSAVINFLRIEADPPVRPSISLRRSLGTLFGTPAYNLQLPLSIAVVLIVLYIRSRLRGHAALLAGPKT
jgi:hypothetical protein